MQQKGTIGATKNFSAKANSTCVWCGGTVTVRKDRPTTGVCRECKRYEKFAKRG